MQKVAKNGSVFVCSKTKGNRCHFASFCFEAKIFFKAKTAHPSAYLVIMLPIGGESQASSAQSIPEETLEPEIVKR